MPQGGFCRLGDGFCNASKMSGATRAGERCAKCCVHGFLSSAKQLRASWVTAVVGDGHRPTGQSWRLKKEPGAGKDISRWPRLFSKGQAPKINFRAESKAEEKGAGQHKYFHAKKRRERSVAAFWKDLPIPWVGCFFPASLLLFPISSLEEKKT